MVSVCVGVGLDEGVHVCVCMCALKTSEVFLVCYCGLNCGLESLFMNII